MDLKNFISKTLTSIREGIKEANSDQNFYINANTQVINFDVAVEIEREKGNSKGGGVNIKVVEGNLSSQTKIRDTNVSRINFTVGVKKTIQ